MARNKDLILLKLRPVKDMYLILEVDKFNSTDNEKAYYYNEYTCPTNYLHYNLREVVADGEYDPHGVFEFVKRIDAKDDEEEDVWLADFGVEEDD